MSKPTVKVRVFTGKTLEDACAKADNLLLEEYHEKIVASHVVLSGDEISLILICTYLVE